MHFMKWRFDEHRTLVPNNSFFESDLYLGELVLSIRLDRGRKGTSQILCGQQDADKFYNRKKYNARKRFEFRSTDQ